MNRMRISAVLVSALVGLASQAVHAKSSSELQRECATDASALDRFACLSFISGVLAGYDLGVTRGALFFLPEKYDSKVQKAIIRVNTKLGICVPADVTNGQIVQIVTKFLDDRPDQLHRLASVNVTNAVQGVFPCAVTPNSAAPTTPAP
ncbi:hypothetical protein IAG25_35470 [Caballeronia sp. EK]|uniref:Rap1a/Tai family immunity protein n=1 Tax=Caballeronia sp. EK TaxID=2767469 RepID=UPI001655CC58|nr:Rap1a/Tai family immunity protein [Caballeronia sp. EK]MBC8642108.1 hypothetical protein [Caballeronia sp. EK]